MSEGKKIPKTVLKSLMQYCHEQSKETGTSTAEIFRDFLELMRKYADYFFKEPWPEKLEVQYELSEEDYEFIDKGENYADKVDRLTAACLRKNISMEGLDLQGFVGYLDFHGRVACGDCVVSEATWLREQIVKMEQARKEVEEAVKAGCASPTDSEMHAYYNSPEVIRDDKMRRVNLRFFEEHGRAKGKSCTVSNWSKCPYGEESGLLLRDGRLVKAIWRLVEWYNDHWNRSQFSTPSGDSVKWYHYDEPGIIDVTSYDDIIKALEDGRMKKIAEEHERYEKEYEA